MIERLRAAFGNLTRHDIIMNKAQLAEPYVVGACECVHRVAKTVRFTTA